MQLYSPLVVDRFAAPAEPADLFAALPPEPGRFLLESAGGPGDLVGWSLLGRRPFLTLQARGRELTLHDAGGSEQRRGDPFDALDELLARYPVAPASDLPPFCGGLVGYFAYDTGRCIERLPATAVDDLRLPDVCLGAYSAAAAYNHATGQISVLALPLPGAEEVARDLAARLRSAAPMPPPAIARGAPVAVTSNFTRAAYCQAVARAIEYIYAGDVFQVNLAQRFTAELSMSPWMLYRRLRHGNPAPFAAFFDAGEFQVVSASPERFLRVQPAPDGDTRLVETRPIKGTRPRGATPAADAALRTALWESEKDRAELTMIVDLERNDLGRVCRYGTVQVPELRRIEAFPTVFHTVGTVTGVLRPAVTPGQLLRATFPGGSVTGAPKIRAMQIIEELEGLRRGVYCGSLGYLSFTGHADLNILIRTMVCSRGRTYFHAGGGIVADSDPETEYEETVIKARALVNALAGRRRRP